MSEQIDGCPVCEGRNPMTWMFTHLSPPATVQSCEEDAVVNIVSLLAIMLNVMPEWLYDVVSGAVNAAADEHDAAVQPEPEVKPAPAKRGRAKPKIAAVEVEADV